MNYRQVHLDFHTSEKIKGIGNGFSKEQFQKALILGHVNSITIFSKCHHGWAYHPSDTNEMHPELDFDLLGAQIAAAHEIGVKTPVYLSAGFDEKYASRHRNHLVRNTDESTVGGTKDFVSPGYHKLCLNSPYLDVLLSQIKEVCENYDADGIFLDIVGVQPCYCETCMNQLFAEGKDPSDAAAVNELAERVYANYLKRVRETIDSVKPGLPVFHNGGHIRRGRRDLAFANSHLELESLPTGGWGYDHFPVSAAYARTLGMEFLGMTGKFHRSWGEFGGFKHPNALRYEVALSAANGARCSIGDQLHPSGEMDIATYTLIGKAYKEIEEKEEYLEGAENIADIAVLGSEALKNYYSAKTAEWSISGRTGRYEAGCARILLEGKYLFNYIDADEKLDKYKLVILPDSAVLDEELAKRLKEYTSKGGKILASGNAGVDENGKFMLDFGCEMDGKNELVPSYARPQFEIDSLENSAYLIYSDNYKLKNVTGKVLINCENQYFNRTIMHFCSHLHTPNNKADSVPGAVMGKDGAYIGWEVFNEYAVQGSITVKEMVIKIIDMLLEDKSVCTSLPAQGVVTVAEQKNRKIVHLLYASPVKRGLNVDIIEDIIPVYETKVRVKCDKAPSRVYKAPQNEDISYEYSDGYAEFTVDKFECHQMIALEF